MPDPISGIHHITAIAGNPQTTLDFYTQALGLRLVKLTVNFDDPGTYHFYFGDETGHPGTILTFFPWAGIRRGRRGLGQVTVVSFIVPPNSLGFWQERLKRLDVTTSSPFPRFDEEVLTLLDPDGLQIELIAREGNAAPGWANGSIPVEQAIRGFAAPTLMPVGFEQTAALLEVLGLRQVTQSGPRYRFSAAEQKGPGGLIDIEVRPNEMPGQMGGGVVHHIAFRAPGDAQQLEWREELTGRGLDVTPVLDRQYFNSIYFREPGGILFEIATDPPGFTIDEPVESLGTQLKLPSWFEPQRGQIESLLPQLRLPKEVNARVQR